MSDDLTLGVRIDGGGSLASEAKTARDEIVNLKGATDDLGASTQRLSDAQKNSATGWKTFKGDADQYMAAVRATTAAHEAAAEKIYVVNDAYLKAAEGAKENAAGMDKTAFATNRAMQEMVVLGREVERGNFSRLPGTLSIIAQGLGPIGWEVAAVTAALAAGGYAWYEWGDAAGKAAKKAQTGLEEAEAAAKKSKHMNDAEKVAEYLRKIRSLEIDNARIESEIETQQNIERTSSNNKKIADKIMFLAQTRAANREQIENLKRDEQALADKINPTTIEIARQNSELYKTYEIRLKIAKLTGGAMPNAPADAAIIKDAAGVLNKKITPDDGSAQRLASQLGAEKIYFAQVAAAEENFDQTAEAREAKRFANESINWQKRYEKAQQEHKWQIGEEESFQAALGQIIKGHQERQAHDAAAGAEVDRKTAEAKAKHMADAMNSEKNFFDKIHVMAADSGAFGLAREKLRYDRELLALDVGHKKTAAAVALDHALSLEEEAAYLQAKEDLEVTYKARTSEGTKTFGVSLVQFEHQTTEERIQTLATGLTNMTAVGAQKNHALFEINKRAAEVNAIVSGRQAVQDSYAFGAKWGGPWGGAAMAAIAVAATMANVDAIESTQFGGGGGGISSVGGGGGIPSLAPSPGVPVSVQSMNSSTPLPTISQAAPAPQQINLTIVGNEKSTFTYDQVVNQLIPMLGQAAGNGVNIKVTMA